MNPLHQPPKSHAAVSRLLFRIWLPLVFMFVFPGGMARAQVPGILSYQGHVTVNNAAFDGNGQFKFSLVNASGGAILWKNAVDTSPVDNIPDAAVTLPVSQGLYTVRLGDTSVSNMLGPIPADVFTLNSDVRLRVWFNDGTNGFQQLTPDQRITSVGYALSAAKADFAAVAQTALSASVLPGGQKEFMTATGNGPPATFTVPAGVFRIMVEAWGAGGGGAGGEGGYNFDYYTTYGGGEGGGGGYGRKFLSVSLLR